MCLKCFLSQRLWSWLSVTIGRLSQLGSGKSLGERVPSRQHSAAASDWRNIYIVWQSMRRTLTWKGKQWSEEERRGSLCGFSRVRNWQRLAVIFAVWGMWKKKSLLLHVCKMWFWKNSVREVVLKGKQAHGVRGLKSFSHSLRYSADSRWVKESKENVSLKSKQHISWIPFRFYLCFIVLGSSPPCIIKLAE